MTSMHPRKLLFEFGTRDFDYICRSCLSASQKRALPARVKWSRSIRHTSSQNAQAQAQAQAQAASSTQNHSHQTDIAADQEAERRKILDTLGLSNFNNHNQTQTRNETQEHATINFFEQDDNGRLRRLDNRDHFDTSLAGSSGIVDTKLKLLEQQLGEAQLLVNKLEGLAKEMKEREAQHQKTSVLREKPSEQYLIPFEGWRTIHTRFIVRLNKAIQYAVHQLHAGGVKIKAMNRLWSAYSRARPAFGTNWDAIPRPTWELLLTVFGTENEDNPNRMAHVFRVTSDMQAAGVPLTKDQQLLSIEAMFLEGMEDAALKHHRTLIGTLGTDPETFIDFWELGLHMHCRLGNIDKAQDIVDKIFDSPYQKDPRALLPFIRVCAADSATVDQGYKAYQRLKALLGASMKLPDYDLVVAAYLSTNQTEYALYVFADMMTSGAIDLRESRRLPPSIANPFFFGKWVKRLVLGGNLAGAYNVLLYMKEKAIPPRPMQVNALLGSWLRSQTAENIDHAEEVGWAMINARIQFVNCRRLMSGLNPVGQGWPNATLETFKLLAESYKDRRVHRKMSALWTAFNKAELAPDTFMMNQLLLSHQHNQQPELVSELYSDLRKKYRVQPDPWTFIALWQSLPVNHMWMLYKDSIWTQISRGRALFAEMVASASNWSTGSFDTRLAAKILHTFRRAKDTVGLLAAVRALRYLFEYVPPEGLIFELLLGVEDLETSLRKATVKSRLMTHSHRIEAYLKHRLRELAEAGELKEGENLSEAKKREELRIVWMIKIYQATASLVISFK
ncbi:hypothetical protein SLS62_001275 [Diatrype stigma]|uniref:Pentatricopeptide repeat protein n=1 Tax=Diatrype stigma TaxID=117547 RepID=A0AAN9YWY0_9PEZI